MFVHHQISQKQGYGLQKFLLEFDSLARNEFNIFCSVIGKFVVSKYKDGDGKTLLVTNQTVVDDTNFLLRSDCDKSVCGAVCSDSSYEMSHLVFCPPLVASFHASHIGSISQTNAMNLSTHTKNQHGATLHSHRRPMIFVTAHAVETTCKRGSRRYFRALQQNADESCIARYRLKAN